MVIQAIVDGLRESVLAFSHNVEGTSPKDVLDMVLVTQYFDTMKVTRGKEMFGQRGRTANAFIEVVAVGEGGVRCKVCRSSFVHSDVLSVV